MTRYAAYYAPAAGDPLDNLAADWLGRDAFTGAARPRPAFPALAGFDLDAATAEPRFYGFHATLRAPFNLADGLDERDLLAATEHLAAGLGPFEAGLEVKALGRFVALRLAAPSPAMQELHEACMQIFEPLRAPLSPADIERRRRSGLDARQEELLAAWGYPHVFENFRFHMTLTGALPDEAARARFAAALADYFPAEVLAHRFDGLAIFRQDNRDSPFTLIARAPFGGG